MELLYSFCGVIYWFEFLQWMWHIAPNRLITFRTGSGTCGISRFPWALKLKFSKEFCIVIAEQHSQGMRKIHRKIKTKEKHVTHLFCQVHSWIWFYKVINYQIHFNVSIYFFWGLSFYSLNPLQKLIYVQGWRKLNW